MLKIKNNQKFLVNLYIFIILSIIFLMVIKPDIAIQSFWQGVVIWAKNVMPALLPFFILSKLLTYTPLLKFLGKKFAPITHKLYGVGGVSGYIYIMSIISGYPVGAKLTSDLYLNGTISSGQAQTISSFVSTSGPLFIIGTVAVGFFNSPIMGAIIIISHFLSAIINGFIYRQKNPNDMAFLLNHHSQNIIADTVKSSIESILLIGGFIALSYMILEVLIAIKAFAFLTYPLFLLGIPKDTTLAIISGIIEVTTGTMMLSKLSLSFKTLTLIVSFLVSFGGLCIHAQAYTFLKSFKMPYFKFLLQKSTHAILSTIITFIILLFI